MAMAHHQLRALTRLNTAAAELAILERHTEDDGWWGPDYTCGERCNLCVPDWPERDEKLRQINRPQPLFTVAERLLAQAGLEVRLTSVKAQ